MTAPAQHQHSDHDSDEASDFLQRLGDLDQFIGTGTGQTPKLPVRGTGLPIMRNTSTPPLPTVAPDARITRRLFDARHHAAPDESEASDFLERLGELDQFISPEPASLLATDDATVESSEADEASDFLQRLGDLDQFIGGGTPPPLAR